MEDVNKLINFIYEKYITNPFHFEKNKQYLFKSLSNVFYNVNVIFGNEMPSNYYDKMFRTDITMDEIKRIFEEEISNISLLIETNKKSHNDKLATSILDYLQNNYNDVNLTAYTVSKDMKIAEKYLLSFIKEQTGKTFSEILLNERISKAKEYLINTDYNNDTIASLCGFGVVNTFYRNFNKVVGLSPKNYRENLQTVKIDESKEL